MKQNEIKICGLCSQEYTGYGNNSWQVEERICDDCNNTSELSYRINLMRSKVVIRTEWDRLSDFSEFLFKEAPEIFLNNDFDVANYYEQHKASENWYIHELEEVDNGQ